ncbi:MAG: GntR family transcriptional regulator [Cytophagales bacterium]|nr:GntR family transcriptional regulator [Cytophagales bacterium]
MTESLKENAYKHIRIKLGKGELNPDGRLSNRALAKEIGIGFIPIREAINQLVSEGIVV